MKPVVYYTTIKTVTNIPQGGAVAILEGVTDHPRLGDCERVRTSKIVDIKGDEIETMNTVYRKLAP